LPASEITKIEISKPRDPLSRWNERTTVGSSYPKPNPVETGKISVILESIEKVTLTALGFGGTKL